MELNDDVLWILIQEDRKIGLITSTEDGDKTYHGDLKITKEQRQEAYDGIIQGFPQKDMPIQEITTPTGMTLRYGYGKINELQIETTRDIHSEYNRITGDIGHVLIGERTTINLTILGYNYEKIHADNDKIIIEEYIKGHYDPYKNSNRHLMTSTYIFDNGYTEEIRREIE